MTLFPCFSLLLLPPVAAALFKASLLLFFFLSSITRHSLSERGTLGMIRQILQRAVTLFSFLHFQSFFIHDPFVPIRCFFWGVSFMEWRGLGGRLQRSLVTAASFMDYGSLVVINGITADHRAFVSLLGRSGLS